MTEPNKRTEPNTRVIAFLSATNNVVRSLGGGTYVGDHTPPPNAIGFNFGIPNPKLEMDDGTVVWGCECWWGPEQHIKNKFASPPWIWEHANIEQIRKEHSREKQP